MNTTRIETDVPQPAEPPAKPTEPTVTIQPTEPTVTISPNPAPEPKAPPKPDSR